MGLIALYALAAVLGLIVGAYACLGVIFVVAPSMGSEDTLWYIYPCALAGAIGLPMLLRHFRKRRQASSATRSVPGP